MIFIAYTTVPFVSYVHIKLPGFARRSKDKLMQWVQQVPPNAEIDLTTMRFSGHPRVSRMLISDLNETKARLGVANLAKVSNFTIKPWWMGKEPTLFYVTQKSAVKQTPPWQKAIWQHILDRIHKQ